jgi:hypothetical protein
MAAPLTQDMPARGTDNMDFWGLKFKNYSFRFLVVLGKLWFRMG